MSLRERSFASLSRKIESKEAKIGVIGLGFIGTTLMQSFLHAGFSVVGHDNSSHAISEFKERMQDSRAKKTWSVSKKASILLDSDVLIVAVRVLIISESSIDLAPLKNVAQLLSNYDLTDRLIILESTLPGGITRRFARNWLKIDEAAPVFFAHCPERLSVGDSWKELKLIPHLVGGIDYLDGQLSTQLMQTIVDQVVSVSAPEVSELAKLLENASATTSIALISEIARLARRFGVTGTEVCNAAATKPSGYIPFFPGPGIGGHCLVNDLSILQYNFEMKKESSAIVNAVIKEADSMPDILMKRIVALLPNGLEGAHVLLIGVGFKPGSADLTQTPAEKIVRSLRDSGAIPAYTDRHVPIFKVDGEKVEKIESEKVSENRFKLAVVMSGDNDVDLATLFEKVDVVFDASGGRAHGVDQVSCLQL